MTLPLVFLLVLTLSFVAFFASTEALGVFNQIHHYWLGVLLLATGLLLQSLPVARWVPLAFEWCGVALILDDALQHVVQLFRPSFRSPIHLLYRHLIYNPTHKHQ